MAKRFSPKVFASLAMVLFCLPLAILLGLQYLSLKRGYEENRRATLANLNRYVDLMVKKTALTYSTQAEKLLSLPANRLNQEAMHDFLKSLEAEDLAFARYFFFLVFTEPKYEFFIYDTGSRTWISSPLSQEQRSVSLAAGHWHLRNKKGFPAPAGFQTNHDLVDHPSIMKVIVGPTGDPKGLTGIILDPQYFVSQFLPEAIPQTLRLDSDQPSTQTQIFAQVLDGRGKIRLTSQPGEATSTATANGFFDFIFTDWSIRIFADDTLEVQAKQTLFWGMVLAGLVSLLPVLGVAFTLRAMLKYRQISAMKSDFVANVSHELRTPMASIHLLGEMMRTGKVHSIEKVREYGNLIEIESDRMVALIENILDFNKIESGKLVFKPASFDLTVCLKTVLGSFQTRPDLEDIVFELRLPESSIRYTGDETALKQALFNLLDNAVKYGPPKQMVRLECEADDAMIRLFVYDQGPGIADQEKALIFERFYRITTGDVHTVRGNGLGLTIAQQIAKGHGGEISVTTHPDGGCCFVLTLPRKRSAS